MDRSRVVAAMMTAIKTVRAVERIMGTSIVMVLGTQSESIGIRLRLHYGIRRGIIVGPETNEPDRKEEKSDFAEKSG